jgi:adhesin transport system outer membrane protein
MFRFFTFPRALLGASVLVCSLAQAQPGVRLSDLLTSVAREHPSIKNRESERTAAIHELEAARWARFPSFGSQLQTINGGAQAVLTLKQPIWTGGRITGQIDLSQAQVEGADASLSQARLQVMQETASAFFESLRLEARLVTAQSNEAEHRRFLEIIQRRVRSEVSPRTDETQAAARLQQALAERLQTERQLRVARLKLEQLAGRPVGVLRPPRQVRMAMWDEGSLLAAARRYSPEHMQLVAQVVAADAGLDIARAQLMPQVALSYERKLGSLRLGEDRDRLYLGMDMQTGPGLSYLSATQTSLARRQATLDAIEVHDRQLAQTISTTWSEIQALESQLQPARALLSSADEVVESYLRQFQVGKKTWLDLLNAQREKTNAHYALADLEYPRQLAQLQLLLLAGHVNAQYVNAIDD